MTNDGIWAYSWDADHRLVAMQRTTAAVTAGFSDQRIEFDYDYLGRRIQKVVQSWNGSTWVVDEARRYVYDGWNLIAEFNAPGGTSIGGIIRSYTWGLDIASGASTGGVGALVQLTDHGSGKDYLPTYDANGNLAALVNASTGNPDAIYEYTPYGELLRAEGSYAQENPFRFSTKYTDTETGMVYYGYRYYDPANGRFLNRDPIQENGGLNLYAFAGNDPVNNIDVLGERKYRGKRWPGSRTRPRTREQWRGGSYADHTEHYEEVLESPFMAWGRQLMDSDRAAAESHYAMVEDWLWNIEKPEFVHWFNWNQRRKRVLRQLTPEQREVANEYQRDLYEERRRKAREARTGGIQTDIILHDIEVIGIESELVEDAYRRNLLPRIPVAERAPAYVSTTSGLLSFAGIVRENQLRSERLNPQSPKGWGWRSINDIPTINETADRLMMLPTNIMVGLVGGEAFIGAMAVKATPYVIQGGRAAFNFSHDASAVVLYGGARTIQLSWETGRTVATGGYIWATTRPEQVAAVGDFIMGFVPGDTPRNIPAAAGSAVYRGIELGNDHVNLGVPLP